MTSVLKRINSILRKPSDTPPPLPPRAPPFQLFALPPELLLHTISFLPPATVLQLLAVNRTLNALLKSHEATLTQDIILRRPTSQLLAFFPVPPDIRWNSFRALRYVNHHGRIAVQLARHLAVVLTKGIHNREVKWLAERQMVHELIPVFTNLHSQMRRDTMPKGLSDLELIRCLHAYVLVRDRVTMSLGPRTATSRALLAAVMRSGGLEEALMYFEVDKKGATAAMRKRYMARMSDRINHHDAGFDWEAAAKRELALRRLGAGCGMHAGYYQRWTWEPEEVEVKLCCEDCLDV